MKFWTYSLTGGSLEINAEDGATFISLQCDDSTGSCTITGGIPFKTINSTAITLTSGQGVNFAASSPQSPLDGITINWVAGTIDIIVGF